MADLIQFEDQLRIEGINFKGFGVLPKYVMTDRDLTIEAKTIYAYFCSYAGNGDSIFPGRDKILIDLPMSKDAYYKHFKLLSEQGYIFVVQQKQDNKFSNNVYTLVSNPKKFADSPKDFTENPYYSRICFSGLKSLGYGIIPKAVMIDERLPVKAKGIYAYFCSYTGSGDNAFPHKDQILYHLQISEPTYYKFYKLLTALNYISAVQRHIDGRLQINDYFLNDAPNTACAEKKRVLTVSLQDLKKQDTGELQDSKIQDTRKQDLKKQDARKQDTNINSININSINKNNTGMFNLSFSSEEKKEDGACPVDLSSISEREREEVKRQVRKRILTDKALPFVFSQNIEVMTEAIHFMTSWEEFYPHGYPDELEQRVYNLFNEALIEMCCSPRTMNLKGALVSSAKIIEKINELAVFEASYVDMTEISEPAMNAFIAGAMSSEIRNPLNYMKACIYDAIRVGNIGFYADMRRIEQI